MGSSVATVPGFLHENPEQSGNKCPKSYLSVCQCNMLGLRLDKAAWVQSEPRPRFGVHDETSSRSIRRNL